MSSAKGFAILRIIFGFIWLIDAYFKWLPTFISEFTGYLTGALEGQSTAVQWWINLWIHIVGVNPEFFAYAVAVAETLIAISLILGLFTRWACYGGILLSLVIWSTAEGLGGPYVAGSTDIGSAIIYVLVFAALILGESWKDLSFSSLLNPRSLRN